MKKIFLGITVLPLILMAQDKGKKFNLNGKIRNLSNQVAMVYLQYRSQGDWKTDSVQPKNGKYGFTGNIEEPVLARMRIKYVPAEPGKLIALNSRRDATSVFLEPGKIKVVSIDSFSRVNVKGSVAHTEFMRLNEQFKPFDEQLGPLYARYSEYGKAKDRVNQAIVEKQIDDIDNARTEAIYGTYIRTHPASPIAMYVLDMYSGFDINAEKIEPLFEALPEATRNFPTAIEFRKRIELAKKTGIGKIAMDFTQNDTLGKPVTLSSFRGRYLLIDFWASWCGPCRVENPNVVKTFNKYREKGFHIIGVSLDRPGQQEKWLKAIHDDGLTWTQVSDLKFWQNEVALMYGIQAIPQNLLLDREGKIIARNLRGEELDQKLGEAIEGKKAF